MAALAERALTDARTQQVERSGILGGVQDWSIVDATTVTVRDARQDEGPGTGDEAALKGHTGLSGGCGAPMPDHFSPVRAPDSRHLPLAEAWRGCGRLADLASASLARWRACHAHGVRGVIRLKDHWKPQVDARARGQGTQAFCPGTDLEALRDQDIRVRDGRVIEAAVQVGGDTHPWPLRRVGVATPQG
jgi:hypothetical protein